MVKIGILEGSLRKASLSRAFGRKAGELAGEAADISILPSCGNLPLYNQDVLDAGVPDPVNEMAEAVAAVDAVLFVTPEYNWSIPGTLKNAIDWLSRLKPNPLDGKPAAIWTIAPGLLGGARAHEGIRHVLHSQNMHVMAKPEVQVARARTRIDLDSGEITDADTVDFLKAHLQAFATYSGRFSG